MPSAVALYWHILREVSTRRRDERVPEPDLVMADPSQADAFMAAGREDGPIAPTYLFHTLQISRLLRPGDRVLDLACGPANQLAQVARLNDQVEFTGVDASESMLNLAAETVGGFGLTNVRFEPAFIQQLTSFADDSVDAVISTMSLHHLPDYETLEASLREAARVLKPGGVVYIADFGRMKRDASRRFFVGQVDDGLNAVFVSDYLNSLRAAFTVEQFREAVYRAFDGGPQVNATGLVPFMVIVSRGTPGELDEVRRARAKEILDNLPEAQRRDFQDLQRFFKLGGVSTPEI